MVFIYTLIGILIAVGIGYYLVKMGDYHDSFIVVMAGICVLIFSAVLSLGFALMVGSWIGAEHKARIINREYKTDYTAEEIFFASDVIDTIQEIKRKRVEVNGDLLREEGEGK